MHGRDPRQQQPEPLNNLNANGRYHNRMVAGSNNFNGANVGNSDAGVAIRVARQTVLGQQQARNLNINVPTVSSAQQQQSQHRLSSQGLNAAQRRAFFLASGSGRVRTDNRTTTTASTAHPSTSTSTHMAMPTPTAIPTPAPVPAAPAAVKTTPNATPTAPQTAAPVIAESSGARIKEIGRKYPLWLPEYKRRAFNVSLLL